MLLFDRTTLRVARHHGRRSRSGHVRRHRRQRPVQRSVLPVQAEFSILSTLELIVYYIAFAAAVLASVLLIAPSVHQRVRSPVSGLTRQTEDHLDAAVRVTIVGTAPLLVALTCVSYLVTSLISTGVAAGIAAAVIAGTAAYTWFYQPIVAFGRKG